MFCIGQCLPPYICVVKTVLCLNVFYVVHIPCDKLGDISNLYRESWKLLFCLKILSRWETFVSLSLCCVNLQIMTSR